MGKILLYDLFDKKYYEVDDEEFLIKQKAFLEKINKEINDGIISTYGEIYERLGISLNRKMKEYENVPINFNFNEKKGETIIYRVHFIDTVEGESFSWEYDSLDEAIERINHEKTLAITYVEKITKEQV